MIGWNYPPTKPIDESIACFERALAIQSDDLYALRGLAACYEATKDYHRCHTMLGRVTELTPNDSKAWQSLGMICWKLDDFEGALRAFERYRLINPDEPIAWLNLGLSCVKLGYIADAADAFRVALAKKSDYSAAAKEMSTIEPRLRAIAEGIQSRPARQGRSEYTGSYLNPFELLNYAPPSIEEWDDPEYRRGKKKLLAELDLSDGKVSWMNDTPVDRSRVLKLLGDLDDQDRRESHFIVWTHKDLLRFLTHGHLGMFSPLPESDSETAWDALENDSLVELIADSFAEQYDRQLVNHVVAGDEAMVVALNSRRLRLPDSHQDRCYKSTYDLIRKVADGVETRAEKAVETHDRVRELYELLSKKITPSVLNALPIYFQSLRTQIAQAIRSVAIDCYNEHSDGALSSQLLVMARSLATDKSLQARLDDDAAQLEKNLRQEHEAREYKSNNAKIEKRRHTKPPRGMTGYWQRWSPVAKRRHTKLPRGRYILQGENAVSNVVIAIVIGVIASFAIYATMEDEWKGRTRETVGNSSNTQNVGAPDSTGTPNGNSRYQPTNRDNSYSREQPAAPRSSYEGGLSKRIDTGKARAKAMELEIDQMDSQLETLSTRLQRLKDDVETYENRIRTGVEVNRYLYQQSLDDHNRMVDQYNRTLAERNLKYTEYSREIDSVNVMVSRHNRGER